MIKVQLLLLLGLVGPFCAVAHASTLVTPLERVSDIPAATDILEGATDAPTAEPKTATDEVGTKAPATDKPVTTQVDEAAPNVTEAAPTETEATEAAGQEAATTEAPAVATMAPANPEATAEAEEEELVVEEEGTGSGQVVGIVIGALVAVIIVIAVVIALVRRMGKYSP
ncbi:cytochrome c1-like [Oncorhynchus tshawytscha]|uniref:cytochrome c1-like n=1 Tax=Oncorhynchus tshawytscha TaxID=74940 RepID=UPI001C3D655C|nr:cytochrome c1-like [Oncorhynchus tshawytscha]